MVRKCSEPLVDAAFSQLSSADAWASQLFFSRLVVTPSTVIESQVLVLSRQVRWLLPRIRALIVRRDLASVNVVLDAGVVVGVIAARH